ncbi:hypothetical protein [Kribbella sp. VKM Ac-2566]|uniref:hypothetical protein n=1 Tax=Kribbella sp. VKM Ac-2566 TaxID=2512218 RepID=UPI0010ECBDC3|nr:hypothetical protein [Kribbella sp. VKM Ac-2566]TDW92339.1 hypothetical protein EV647_4176 [Kribbella sp. VKM Ac-2566]
MSSLIVFMVLALLLAVAAIVWGIVALVRRQRYIGSIRERGWSFVNSPTFDAVARLSNPPFGLGFVRKPDDQITGRTATGRTFQVIEYKSAYWSGWVGMVTLSRRLPELWITGGRTAPRYGVLAQGVVTPPQLGPGWQLGAMDPAFAQEVMTPELCVQLNALAAGRPGVNLGVDGDQIVVLNPPRKDLDQLGPWLEQLDAIAAAIDATPLDHWIQPEPEPRLRFYHHPDWYWIGVDDSLLQYTPVNRGGYGHRTDEVIRGRDGDGPPFVAFKHHWKTSRTETYTDSNGNSQTRTVVESHSEPILGFQLPVRMPQLSVGPKGLFRNGISFESAAFNDRFAVTAADTKFAYDVIHPRQMEYLMATPGAPFRIVEDWVWFTPGEHSQPAIAFCSAYLRGFLGRVPRFVWRNLGLPDTPYPSLETTAG